MYKKRFVSKTKETIMQMTTTPPNPELLINIAEKLVNEYFSLSLEI